MTNKTSEKDIKKSAGVRGNLKKRKLVDEFKRKTVKARYIILFGSIYLSLAAVLTLFYFYHKRVMTLAGDSGVGNTGFIIMGLLVLVFVFLLLAGRLVTRGMLFPLRRMVERMIEITDSLALGKGDFTTRISIYKNDEIGELRSYYNRLIELIQNMFIKVKSTSQEVFHQTEKVASGSEELAAGTSRQAVSIHETTETLQNFAQIAQDTDQNATEVSQRLQIFNAEIREKRSLIEDVTSTMQDINESSKRIDDIINVINDISFQTNLLALNAAVEAARAGEAGRGFAVVASEVRNLAQKTAESSGTIRDIVSRNVETTKKGMELVQANAEFFASIIRVLEEFSQSIENITRGSHEQAEGIRRIHQSMAHLEEVIDKHDALVNEFTATGKRMKKNSGSLLQMVSNYEV